MIFGSIFKSKWLEIIIQTTLKHQFEDEMIAEYVAQKQQEGDTRDAQDIVVESNDTVIYPDKVRLNYYRTKNNYSARALPLLSGILSKK